eukprot:6179768-Pleurochrysis_carterae.AAC.1
MPPLAAARWLCPCVPRNYRRACPLSSLMARSCTSSTPSRVSSTASTRSATCHPKCHKSTQSASYEAEGVNSRDAWPDRSFMGTEKKS